MSVLMYERFRGVTLPVYDPSEPLGSWPLRSPSLDLPSGGAFRAHGSGQAVRARRTIRRTGMLLAATLLELNAAFAALVAEAGKSGPLYARRTNGGVLWTQAELASVQAAGEPRRLFRYRAYVALDVETELVLYAPPWRGQRHGLGWFLDDGNLLDSGLMLNETLGSVSTLDHTGPTTFDLYNRGTATIDTAILTISAGAAAITSVTITSVGPGGDAQAELVYTGTIAADTNLVIDAGLLAVRNNGVGDYAHLAFGASHHLGGWFRLDPGPTAVEVTITSSQDGQIAAEFWDGFA